MKRVSLLSVIAVCLIVTAMPLHAENIAQKGKVIYDAFCAACHGPEGRGDGPSAHALIPPAPDFADPEIRERLTMDGIYTAIVNGVQSTQMEGWEERLSPEEIFELTQYVLELTGK